MLATEPVPTLLNGEKLLGFAAVAKRLPGHRGTGALNPSTVFRWITKGVRAANGEVVRLEAVRIGGAWRTSVEALARFSAKLTEAATARPNSPTTAPPAPTPRARRRAEEAASKQAEAIFGRAG